jgi:hypothetical protein
MLYSAPRGSRDAEALALLNVLGVGASDREAAVTLPDLENVTRFHEVRQG